MFVAFEKNSCSASNRIQSQRFSHRLWIYNISDSTRFTGDNDLSATTVMSAPTEVISKTRKANNVSDPVKKKESMTMACRAVFRTVMLTEPWRTSPNRTSFALSLANPKSRTPASISRCGCRVVTQLGDISAERRIHRRLCCSLEEDQSSSSTEGDQEPPQEAVLKAISELTPDFDSEVSKTEGRVGQTTNMVLGGTVTDDSTDEWLTLDQKVNSYPTVRGFTAIGTGGDDFVQAMVVAVESVLQHPIPLEQVKQKMSSGGKYVSVNIGPVQVLSSEQVQAVYNAMRRDDRMKYFL
ncbi:hypothetical protein LXL04_011699 [Taraxacum kok-saghyz]